MSDDLERCKLPECSHAREQLRAAEAELAACRNDAIHMRQIIELLAEQPGSKVHRKACRALLERTKSAPWLMTGWKGTR